MYTDHKPITFAFLQDPLRSSSRQARHLEFIDQFTTDIRHIAGKDNVVAVALSRIEAIHKAIDQEVLADSQEADEEMQKYVKGDNALKLIKVPISGSRKALYCDENSYSPAIRN